MTSIGGNHTEWAECSAIGFDGTISQSIGTWHTHTQIQCTRLIDGSGAMWEHVVAPHTQRASHTITTHTIYVRANRQKTSSNLTHKIAKDSCERWTHRVHAHKMYLCDDSPLCKQTTDKTKTRHMCLMGKKSKPASSNIGLWRPSTPFAVNVN